MATMIRGYALHDMNDVTAADVAADRLRRLKEPRLQCI